MNAGLKEKAVQGTKSIWCNTWTCAVNTGRRAKIMGRYTLACWQQQKLRQALHHLGAQTFQALERGESNPLVASEVSEAVRKAKDSKERKEQNYQAIAALKERIRSSCEIPTPDKPGGLEESPEVP
jgi:urease accessory protein UreF